MKTHTFRRNSVDPRIAVEISLDISSSVSDNITGIKPRYRLRVLSVFEISQLCGPASLSPPDIDLKLSAHLGLWRPSDRRDNSLSLRVNNVKIICTLSVGYYYSRFSSLVYTLIINHDWIRFSLKCVNSVSWLRCCLDHLSTLVPKNPTHAQSIFHTVITMLSIPSLSSCFSYMWI